MEAGKNAACWFRRPETFLKKGFVITDFQKLFIGTLSKAFAGGLGVRVAGSPGLLKFALLSSKFYPRR
jgi:hypothetical protein